MNYKFIKRRNSEKYLFIIYNLNVNAERRLNISKINEIII